MDMAALVARVKANREEKGLGLNVRFLREDGTKDEFSFGTVDQANAFRQKLSRQGRQILC